MRRQAPVPESVTLARLVHLSSLLCLSGAGGRLSSQTANLNNLFVHLKRKKKKLSRLSCHNLDLPQTRPGHDDEVDEI